MKPLVQPGGRVRIARNFVYLAGCGGLTALWPDIGRHLALGPATPWQPQPQPSQPEPEVKPCCSYCCPWPARPPPPSSPPLRTTTTPWPRPRPPPPCPVPRPAPAAPRQSVPGSSGTWQRPPPPPAPGREGGQASAAGTSAATLMISWGSGEDSDILGVKWVQQYPWSQVRTTISG